MRSAPEDFDAAALTRALAQGWALALDLQHIGNPAYNRDRGPAHTVALRLHAEL